MKAKRTQAAIGHSIARVMAFAVAVLLATGCKSDLNQQLLERELRYQEDQIYYLQDELAEKQSKLASVDHENTSLRRQLGVDAGDNLAPSRSSRPSTSRVRPAAPIPPARELPEVSPLPAPRGGPPVDFAPPTLEGVPVLPDEPFVPPRSSDLSLPPAAASIDPAARPINPMPERREPALVRASYDEPASAEPVRLVIKPRADMAGPHGLAVALEPRDARERLASGFASDLVVTAYDASLPPGAPPIGRWTIPASDTQSRFRPTGRHRGIALDLPWQGASPAGDHVRLLVQAATATGLLETEALVPVR
jgi:hypothetical protein